MIPVEQGTLSFIDPAIRIAVYPIPTLNSNTPTCVQGSLAADNRLNGTAHGRLAIH
jgi:hypothetical protein